MKLWKKIVFSFSVVLISAFIYSWFLYNKRPADVRLQKADVELNAVALLSAFKVDEAAASKKYVGKVITVSGTIHHLDVSPSGLLSIYLDAGDPTSGVVCTFYPDESALISNSTKGKLVKVKGKCTGILMDVILNKCSMID